MVAARNFSEPVLNNRFRPAFRESVKIESVNYLHPAKSMISARVPFQGI